MDDKPYADFGVFLKKYFRGKVQKISINAGFTCPNRDGTKGNGGCTYCNNQTFSPEYCHTDKSITEQLQEGIGFFGRKYPDMEYLAYFQAYTNTYGPVSYLREIYTAALILPEVAGISIATRPDCLGPEVLSLLAQLKERFPGKFIWIELGLQTMHEHTAAFIRRGYKLSCFEDALEKLQERKLETVVHTILGLPGENTENILETMRYLNAHHIDGIKLQLLHVLKHTDLADYYGQTGFHILSEDEYVDLVIHCLEVLSPDITIHRLTGDGPSDLLIAPLWSLKKRSVLNHIHHELKVRDTWQGRLFTE